MYAHKKYLITTGRDIHKVSLEHLSNLNIDNVTVFNAITPDKLTSKLPSWLGNDIGAVACWHSHIECIKKIANGNEYFGTIFEDDIIPHKNFDLHYNNILSELDDFDVFFWGWGENHMTIQESVSDYIQIPDLIIGAHAYSITKEFAKKFLKDLKYIQHIDIYLSDYAKRYGVARKGYVSLFSQASDLSEIHKKDAEKNKERWWWSSLTPKERQRLLYE